MGMILVQENIHAIVADPHVVLAAGRDDDIGPCLVWIFRGHEVCDVSYIGKTILKIEVSHDAVTSISRFSLEELKL